jgi:CO/xanthine dehydrogenase Mo-binding subunit
MGFVGRSVPRLEDRPLVTGGGTFAADVAFPHMLHMRVVRSAHAHGRIVAIEKKAATWQRFRRSIFASRASKAWPPIASRF